MSDNWHLPCMNLSIPTNWPRRNPGGLTPFIHPSIHSDSFSLSLFPHSTEFVSHESEIGKADKVSLSQLWNGHLRRRDFRGLGGKRGTISHLSSFLLLGPAGQRVEWGLYCHSILCYDFRDTFSFIIFAILQPGSRAEIKSQCTSRT